MESTVTLQSVRDAVFDIKTFVDKYNSIGNAHMVDYFVHDHWNKLVDDELKNDLASLSLTELHSLAADVLSLSSNYNFERKPRSANNSNLCFFGLDIFLAEVQQCQQAFLNTLTKACDVLPFSNLSSERATNFTMKIESKEYMCMKKSHEVSKMSPIINRLCRHCDTDSVLDIGSGKGYLSTFLSLQYDLTVTGLEADENNSSGANIRAKKYLNYWLKHSDNAELKKNKGFVKDKESKFNSIATFLDHHTDLTAVTKSNKYVVTGLHACGDLCCNIITLFSSRPDIVGMCALGCCYHHNTEAFENMSEVSAGKESLSYCISVY